ncbi:hypothetical protein OH492_15115 [Vibrio chagasii]|nr:hypothetical protein [Vibrio chagasii]
MEAFIYKGFMCLLSGIGASLICALEIYFPTIDFCNLSQIVILLPQRYVSVTGISISAALAAAHKSSNK